MGSEVDIIATPSPQVGLVIIVTINQPSITTTAGTDAAKRDDPTQAYDCTNIMFDCEGKLLKYHK